MRRSATGRSDQAATTGAEHAGLGWDYSLGEEIANSITHGAGLAASIAGAAILLFVVAQHHDPLWFAANAAYAASLIILYTASTLYHAIPNRRAKHVFRIMDHAAIYILIAGTYTPFALLNLRGTWGWALCAAPGAWQSSASSSRRSSVTDYRVPPRCCMSQWDGWG